MNLRLDRLFTLGVARPCYKQGANSAHRLPILMYHRISAASEPGVSSYYRVCTSPERFAAQMQWLADAGWRGVSVSEALSPASVAGGQRVCAITFDDGFRDVFIAAVPILRRHGFLATVYLPTAYIGRERTAFKSTACLTWDEVRSLHEHGIELGSHTVNHLQLHTLTWTDIRRELEASKHKIEDEVGVEVTGFAYPYAYPQADHKFCAALSGMLRGLHYGHSVTTTIGRARLDEEYSLKRLPINDDDDRALLLAKLEGAYDWLGVPQSLFKTARHLLPQRA